MAFNDNRTGFEVGANISPFEQAMRRMVGVSRDASSGVSNSFGTMTAPLASLQTAYSAIAGVVSGVLVGGFIKLSDAATLARARIQQLTGNLAETAAVQQDLFAMAQRLQAPYAELQQTFSRMMPSIKEMGGGVREATKLTEILTSTAKLAGASSAEASAGALQFAQALGSGVLQGDELKSILENNQVLARELAAGLGVAVGELKELGANGELTSDRVATALLERAEQIEASVSALPDTVGGAFTQISNSVGELADAFNQTGGVTGELVIVMQTVADVIDTATEMIRQATGASTELGSNTGASTFAQDVARHFAGLIDLAAGLILTLKQVGQAAIDMGSAAAQALSGDLSGAIATFKAGVERAKTTGSGAMNHFTSGSNSFKARMERRAAESQSAREDALADSNFASVMGLSNKPKLTAPGSSSKKGGGGGRKKAGGAKKSRGRSGGSSNPMSQWNEELQAQKLAYLEMQRAQGNWEEFSKESELAFWREKLQRVNAGSKEGLQIRQKIALLELAVHKEKLKETQRLGRAEIEAQRDTDLHSLAMAEQASDTALALGQTTQLQRLQQQQLFEDQRYAIELKAMQDRIELAKLDPNSSPETLAALHEKLLDLQRQSQLRKGQLSGQQAVANKQENPEFMDLFHAGMGAGMDGAGNAMGQMFDSILQRTATFQQAISGMFRQIGVTFMQELVFKPLQGVMMGYVRQTALYRMLTGVQISEQAKASTATTAAKAIETGAVVGMHASQGASGAAASQAAIPVVGPKLAFAAAAAMMGFILAFGGGSGNQTSTTTTRIPSAARGWDIPAGLNPITQLHENEMVLPAEQAQTIRDMAAGGGAAGGTVVINATGGDWIHKKDLARMLQTLKKDYRFT